MTFSAEIKKELIGHIGRSAGERKAELAGVILSGGRLSNGRLKLCTESFDAAKKYFTSFCKDLKIIPETSVSVNRHSRGKRMYFLRVLADAVSESFRDYDIFTASASCRRAFLRGAYIDGGSMSDPHKGYHLDFIVETREQSEILEKLIKSFGVEARLSTRRSRPVVYLKGADEISSMLAVLEASVSMLKFENIRVLRNVKGSTNRRTNCETANIMKTVSASIRQTDDIEVLDERIGLDNLEPQLRETAYVRLNNPDASFAELGKLMNPPIGRSGVNHRLKKISKMAEKLKTR